MIATGSTDALRDTSLQDVARCFVLVDLQLLQAAERGLIRSGKADELSKLVPAIKDLEAVRDKNALLHKDYLRQTSLMSYWTQASHVVLAELSRTTVTEDFNILENALLPLPDYVYIATERGLLSKEDKQGIRLRMEHLDELFDKYHRKIGTMRTLFYR